MPRMFKCWMLGGVVLWTTVVGALEISDSYRSPRNPERRIRPATRLIVLHTTEAHAKSALNKLSERGEAHYCLTEDGTAYRIIDRDRVAFHAGRSMWNGKEDCDEYAVGIEVVGFHDKPMPLKQLKGLRELVANLKKIYNLSDAQVICHSHVAYGAPNKWQKRRHRGRKRCGMLFAMWSVRTRIGLKTRPALDPDVKAGRLIQADPYLAGVLYGKTDTMAAHYAGGKDVASEKKGFLAGLGGLFGLGGDKTPPKPTAKASPPKPVAKKPAAKKPDAKKPEAKDSAPQEIKRPEPTPGSFREKAKLVAKQPNAAQAEMKADVQATERATTSPGNWYLLPNGTYFKDNRLPKGIKLPPATKKLIGYRMGGPLGHGVSAYAVAGKAWNAIGTYYVMDGKVYDGESLKPSDIKAGARVFFKSR